MAAPLASGYSESVLWHDGVDEPDVAMVPPPGAADVVVVGGGYCGLAAAEELASRGRSVVVVERESLGWGASSRNGGMVIPELKAGPQTLEAEYGTLGTRMHAEVEAAFDHVEALAAPGGIACGYERVGQLYLTHGTRGAAALRRLAAEHESVGSPATYVEGPELEAEVGSRIFAAGLVIERTGGLQPAQFHAGLVDRARSAGAALHPGTAAQAIERLPGGGIVVHSTTGTIGTTAGTTTGATSTRDVLLATNAYADGVMPWLRDRVLPMDSFIIATEPLAPELAATVLPTRRMAFNDRNLLWYWRHGPDGRLLFGGRKTLGSVSVAQAREHLYESMLTVHPQLAGVRVDRAWGGKVALTLDRLPHCGQHDGVWFATGCNGSGVALNTYLGLRMARAILGDELPPFAELGTRAIPARSLRRFWLPLVGELFRLDDLRGDR